MISPKTEKRLFFAIGLPCWGIFAVLFWGWFFAYMLLILAIAAAAYLGFVYRKRERRYMRFMKLGAMLAITTFCFTAVTVENPAFWSGQIYRHLDPAAIITPDDPSIVQLSNHFADWVQNANFSKPYYNVMGYLDCWWSWVNYTDMNNPDSSNYYYRNMSTINRTTPSPLDLALLVDYYVRNNTIEWTDDRVVYGVTDFIATPAEILATRNYTDESQRMHDDCDGIAVVTVSLMQHLGLNAYLGSGRNHVFTVVQIPGFKTPTLFNYWSEIHVWAYWKQGEYHIGQPIDLTASDVIFNYDQNQVLPVLAPVISNFFIAWAVGCGAAIVAYVFLRTTPRYAPQTKNASELNRPRGIRGVIRQKQPFQKQYLPVWIFILGLSLAFTGGLYGMWYIASLWPTYAIPFALAVVAIFLRVVDSSRVIRGIDNILSRHSSRDQAAGVP